MAHVFLSVEVLSPPSQRQGLKVAWLRSPPNTPWSTCSTTKKEQAKKGAPKSPFSEPYLYTLDPHQAGWRSGNSQNDSTLTIRMATFDHIEPVKVSNRDTAANLHLWSIFPECYMTLCPRYVYVTNITKQLPWPWSPLPEDSYSSGTNTSQAAWLRGMVMMGMSNRSLEVTS